MIIRCFWCASADTYFVEYECWEEDERGNTMTTSKREGRDDCTPRIEVWWCRDCDGAFVFPVEDDDHVSG